MKRVLDLLTQKNHYLEKFYALNENELMNFAQSNFDNLDAFYKSREDILNVVRYIDNQMEIAQNQIPENQVATNEERQELIEMLAIKDEYVARILEQDLQILSCIEATKNNIIRELQEVRRNRKALSQYKSPQHSTRLDEEA